VAGEKGHLWSGPEEGGRTLWGEKNCPGEKGGRQNLSLTKRNSEQQQAKILEGDPMEQPH